jgi:hypothetical protein
MSAIKDSIITLGEGMVKNYEENIDELLKDDDYKNNERFKKVVKNMDRRAAEVAQMFDPSNEDEDEDEDATVALPEPENQTGASTLSTDQDIVEVITIGDTPTKPDGKDNKRKGKSKDGTASKKKRSKQTPKSKARGTHPPPPMVTPGYSAATQDFSDKDVSERLRDEIYTSHQIEMITNDVALNILKANYGIFCEDGKFYLPPASTSEDAKPVATFSSLMDLRKDLCAKGLPESIHPLSTKEKIDIARWVRYTHVKGLEDGQEINPDDIGEPIPSKFMEAWSILRDKFGCSWNAGTYKVPHGEETKTFDNDGVDGHFARFGIQCIPDDIGENILSRKARLGIELFFATPSFEVLNTL